MMDEAEPRFTAYWSPLGNRREPVTGESVEQALARVEARAACVGLPYSVEVVERVSQASGRVVYRGSVENPGGC